MNDLFIGKIEGDALRKFTIDSKGALHHLFITGQSGSGKTCLVKRLIEEIIINEHGNVLFIDCNDEFSSFCDINDEFIGGKTEKWQDEKPLEFKSVWDKKRDGILSIKANQINISYPKIPSSLKTLLLDFNSEDYPGAYWLLQLIDENSVLRNRLNTNNDLIILARNIMRWFDGRSTQEEVREYGSIINDIRRNMNTLEITRFVNMANYLNGQSYINIKCPSGKKTIDDLLIKSLYSELHFLSLDLLNFEYAHHNLRAFVVLQMLLKLWDEAKERFVKRNDHADTINKPIFIVIDEAHNVSPSSEYANDSLISMEVTRMIRTIAAEGRKFGLFLILISQRPNKIDESVLSECDNFIIMKSTSQTIGRIDDILKLGKSEKEELLLANKFVSGQAFVYGYATESRLVKVKTNLNRTK